MGHEKEQELELLRGQRHRLTVHRHDTALTIEDELARPQDRCLWRAAAARHSMDSGNELLEVERLHEVVVRARVQAGNTVLDLVAGRQHDDHQLWIGPHALGQLHAADSGQHQIEDDELGLEALQLGKRLVTVLGDRDREALVAEADAQEVRNLRLVLDDENAQGIALTGFLRRGVPA
jgi:hypothetical protein